jgi:hypothetical protein
MLHEILYKGSKGLGLLFACDPDRHESQEEVQSIAEQRQFRNTADTRGVSAHGLTFVEQEPPYTRIVGTPRIRPIYSSTSASPLRPPTNHTVAIIDFSAVLLQLLFSRCSYSDIFQNLSSDRTRLCLSARRANRHCRGQVIGRFAGELVGVI